MDEYSKILAKYVVNLRYEDLKDEVIDKTKMHLLDAVGNILGAREMPWSRMIIEIVKQIKGEPQATVIGEEGRYPSMMAALANGTMAHGIDADDSGARPSWAHPGSCIIPAAYAAAEAVKASGKELITALVAGYEVNCRVDSSIYPGLRDRGFHATGVVGTIGAATAAGKIFGLNEEQMVNAFGLAGIQAAGLDEIGLGGAAGSREQEKEEKKGGVALSCGRPRPDENARAFPVPLGHDFLVPVSPFLQRQDLPWKDKDRTPRGPCQFSSPFRNITNLLQNAPAQPATPVLA